MQGASLSSTLNRGDKLDATLHPRHSGHKKRCPECRHIFTSSRSDAVYCSQACRQKAARKRSKAAAGRRRQSAKHVTTCMDCKQPFVTVSASSRYCSQACRQSAYRQRREQAIAELVRLAERQQFSGQKVKEHVQRWPLSRLNKALADAKRTK
jgi:hypothetical protein